MDIAEIEIVDQVNRIVAETNAIADLMALSCGESPDHETISRIGSMIGERMCALRRLIPLIHAAGLCGKGTPGTVE